MDGRDVGGMWEGCEMRGGPAEGLQHRRVQIAHMHSAALSRAKHFFFDDRVQTRTVPDKPQELFALRRPVGQFVFDTKVLIKEPIGHLTPNIHATDRGWGHCHACLKDMWQRTSSLA